jgi:glycosyltransferase involved in cell wall biosynthesis
MAIVYITAGAAGMYCGSCMRDNTLVAALVRQGHDALLVPTYTPIRTDEDDVSQSRVFFGGINVYLQQKLGLFRWTPWFFDRLLDGRGLLNWVSRFAVKTQAQELADLTISMLKGTHGHQRKEVAKLVRWLARDIKPRIINLTNALLSGMVAELKRQLGVPVLCSLQGDDIFLESLPEPHRRQAIELIGKNCRQVDGFIATSGYYADFMAGYLGIPRERIHVVYPGLNLHGHGHPRPEPNGRPFTIGYFARICPEKGLHLLVEAFRILRQTPGLPPAKLRISGWLGDNNKAYFADLQKKLESWGLHGDVEHVEAPDHAAKVRFLHSIDVLSVPTTYRELTCWRRWPTACRWCSRTMAPFPSWWRRPTVVCW